MSQGSFGTTVYPSMRTLRDGLWLVIDLLDDLMESMGGFEAIEQLRPLRGGALDLLAAIRRLEREALPAPAAVRDSDAH